MKRFTKWHYTANQLPSKFQEMIFEFPRNLEIITSLKKKELSISGIGPDNYRGS